MASTSSIGSSTYFSGSSPYAAQLQQTISRAVTIASLPMEQLQAQQTTLAGQQNELGRLTNSFSSVRTAIANLTNATGIGAFSASVEDSSIATASISAGALAGTYTINVVSTGSQTNAVSANGFTTVHDPSSQNISSSSTYTLSVNGKDYTISDSGGTLNGLAQAINSSSANVQATVVNVGGSSTPDYRLSIQSLNYAPDTLQLTDGTTDLLTTLATGSNVTYQVNGQPDTPISSSSRNVTISTGLSVQLNKVGTTQVTVAQSADGIASALSQFANAYNSVVAELAQNRGQAGGALSGQSIIYQLQDGLRSLSGFSSSGGSVSSLADLGLSFDPSGNLTFDSSAFSATASKSGADLLKFIGDSTSGGFLQAANDFATSITDPTTGLLAQASQTMASQISTLSTKINNDQSQVSQLQASLTAQMASADAAISSLQTQLTELTTLFATIQANNRASG